MQTHMFTTIYNWCQEKHTLPSGTCPFFRLQFCLEEMPLGHPGEVRHSQNPWTWLQVLWEWYLQVLHGRWIGSPLTQAIYGSHVLEAAEHCSRCPDNSDVADVEGFRKFAAISVKWIDKMWCLVLGIVSDYNSISCWLDDSASVDVGTCKTIFKMIFGGCYYYTLTHFSMFFQDPSNLSRALHGSFWQLELRWQVSLSPNSQRQGFASTLRAPSWGCRKWRSKDQNAEKHTRRFKMHQQLHSPSIIYIYIYIIFYQLEARQEFASRLYHCRSVVGLLFARLVLFYATTTNWKKLRAMPGGLRNAWQCKHQFYEFGSWDQNIKATLGEGYFWKIWEIAELVPFLDHGWKMGELPPRPRFPLQNLAWLSVEPLGGRVASYDVNHSEVKKLRRSWAWFSLSNRARSYPAREKRMTWNDSGFSGWARDCRLLMISARRNPKFFHVPFASFSSFLRIIVPIWLWFVDIGCMQSMQSQQLISKPNAQFRNAPCLWAYCIWDTWDSCCSSWWFDFLFLCLLLQHVKDRHRTDPRTFESPWITVFLTLAMRTLVLELVRSKAEAVCFARQVAVVARARKRWFWSCRRIRSRESSAFVFFFAGQA